MLKDKNKSPADDNRQYFYNDEFYIRAEFPIINNWIKEGSKIIDLGCGNGSLMKFIKENKNAENKCPKKFETFFNQFGTDKSFQLNHIKFPLSYSFPSDDYVNTIDSVINKKDFQFINFSEDEKAMESEFDKYEIIITKIREDKMIYKRQGYDNGIFISYEFVWINNCWTMVKILDQST